MSFARPRTCGVTMSRDCDRRQLTGQGIACHWVIAVISCEEAGQILSPRRLLAGEWRERPSNMKQFEATRNTQHSLWRTTALYHCTFFPRLRAKLIHSRTRCSTFSPLRGREELHADKQVAAFLWSSVKIKLIEAGRPGTGVDSFFLSLSTPQFKRTISWMKKRTWCESDTGLWHKTKCCKQRLYNQVLQLKKSFEMMINVHNVPLRPGWLPDRAIYKIAPCMSKATRKLTNSWCLFLLNNGFWASWWSSQVKFRKRSLTFVQNWKICMLQNKFIF